MNNFIGTVDPANPFSGKSPRSDSLLDEELMVHGIKKLMKNASQLRVMKIS